jgi:hypothetical protein
MVVNSRIRADCCERCRPFTGIVTYYAKMSLSKSR